MVKNSIALIGFMGVGKTTIGQVLAFHLGYKFYETDDIIVKSAGKSIPAIFEQDGEIKFREFEIMVCKKLSAYENVVISCGGGVVLNKINIDYLKQNCHIVLLQATPEEIVRRIMMDGKEKRPLVNKPNPDLEVIRLLEFRYPFYKMAAELVIETTGKEIENIVHEILDKTKLSESIESKDSKK